MFMTGAGARFFVVFLLSASALGLPARVHAQSTKPALPMLEVRSCPDCRLRAGIPAAIKRGYFESAEYEGFVLDPSTTVTLQLTEYVERNATLASLLGPLAGRDMLRGTLSVGEREIPIEDSAYSPYAGIMNVAESLGIEAAKQVAKALAEEAGAK